MEQHLTAELDKTLSSYDCCFSCLYPHAETLELVIIFEGWNATGACAFPSRSNHNRYFTNRLGVIALPPGVPKSTTFLPCSTSDVTTAGSASNISHPSCWAEDVTPPYCLTEGIALPSCSAEDVAPPSCSVEDVAPFLCFEPYVTPPSCSTENIAPPSDLAESIAPPLVSWETLLPPQAMT